MSLAPCGLLAVDIGRWAISDAVTLAGILRLDNTLRQITAAYDIAAGVSVDPLSSPGRRPAPNRAAGSPTMREAK